MGDQALDLTIDHLAIDGLEDVFEGKDSPTQDLTISQPRTAPTIEKPPDNGAQDWTVSEAARLLNISEKTVLRRLQRGSLDGYKVQGQFGPEWRINRSGEDSTALDIAPAQPGTTQVIAEAMDSTALDKVIPELKEEIAILRKQLEGAIYRNGYLEAKLEDRDTTIKLLTDSQHTGGAWSRFWSWFTGTRG